MYPNSKFYIWIFLWTFELSIYLWIKVVKGVARLQAEVENPQREGNRCWFEQKRIRMTQLTPFFPFFSVRFWLSQAASETRNVTEGRGWSGVTSWPWIIFCFLALVFLVVPWVLWTHLQTMHFILSIFEHVIHAQLPVPDFLHWFLTSDYGQGKKKQEERLNWYKWQYSSSFVCATI